MLSSTFPYLKQTTAYAVYMTFDTTLKLTHLEQMLMLSLLVVCPVWRLVLVAG